MRFKFLIFSIILLNIVFVSGAGNASFEEVLSSIENAQQNILEMQENNLSTLYVEDVLLEAQNVFTQAKYAAILRGDENSTFEERMEAESVLRFVNWRDVYYDNVLEYTFEIEERKNEAFLLLDQISIARLKINDRSSENLISIFNSAESAFENERYSEATAFLDEFASTYDEERASELNAFGLSEGAKNFFEKNWIYILAGLFVLIILGYFIFEKIRRVIIRRKIEKLDAEKVVLKKLMKTAQEDRFSKNSLSDLAYKARMKKYADKIREIKQILPGLKKKIA